MELPRLEPIYQELKGEGLEILAFDVARDTEGAIKFIEDNQLTYTFIENGEGEEEVIRTVFGVRGFPTSFLIDQEGRIAYCHMGFEEGDEVELEKKIRQLLDESV